MANTTLADLRQKLNDDEIVIDPDDEVWLENTKNRFINQSIRKIMADLGYSWDITLRKYTFTPTNQESALPTGFIRLADPESVRYDGVLLHPMTEPEMARGSSEFPESGGVLKYYVQTQNNVFGLSATPGGGQVEFYYYVQLDKLEEDTDTCPLDDYFDELIICRAAYLCFRNRQGYQERAAELYNHYQELYRVAYAERYAGSQEAITFKNERIPSRLYDGYNQTDYRREI